MAYTIHFIRLLFIRMLHNIEAEKNKLYPLTTLLLIFISAVFVNVLYYNQGDVS